MQKQTNPYFVNMVQLSNGERMPFLIQRTSGLPLEAPTYWSLAYCRALGKQPNTLSKELRSVSLLYLWADLRSIDVGKRLREGSFLSLSEIIDLCGFCGRYLDDILSEIAGPHSNVLQMTAKRRRGRSSDKRNRLFAIRSFVEFSSADHLSQLQQWPERRAAYERVRSEFLVRLNEYIRHIRGPNRDDVGQREGAERGIIDRLLAIIEPSHPDNPFHPAVRFRNYLIVRLLVELGIRRGELLAIYVKDLAISGGAATVTIHRRPDDPNDDRQEKPAVKTAARILPLSARAAELVHEWIVDHRAKLPLAKNSPFLIVASPHGRPMSLSNVNKIFQAIRTRIPDLPNDLGPHVIRHSWNDAFSEQIDRRGNVSPQDEIRWRMRLMGWRNEETAKHYLRRTLRRRSDEFLRKIQDSLDVGK